MGTLDDLVPVLKKLRLSGVMKTLDLRKREALEDDLGIEEFLYRLLQDEVERRDSKQTEVRMRRANFEGTKRLEDFEFIFNSSTPRSPNNGSWTSRPATSSRREKPRPRAWQTSAKMSSRLSSSPASQQARFGC